MKIKEDLNPSDYSLAVLIARFQVNDLHDGHRELLNHILSNHKKVILFLGVPSTKKSKKNPLSFASRKMMIQKDYPTLVILPIKDNRSNYEWSLTLDEAITIPFGQQKTLLYGSRDSFIPNYLGRYNTIELTPSVNYNGTNIRDAIAKEEIDSSDFRAGVIHETYDGYPVTFPTVDVCAYNEQGQFLMAKKPKENLWRFVGGFVDRGDVNYEAAAKREFREETGGSCEVGNMKYILSHKVDDWRYRNEKDGIMTTLFLTKYNFGMAKASDDIVALEWIDIKTFSNFDGIRTKVMPEHREMMTELINQVYNDNLIPNLGERLAERTNVTYTIE